MHPVGGRCCPHKGTVKTEEFELPRDIDPNKPIEIEGVTATFEEWREGVEVSEGRTLIWYGNKPLKKDRSLRK